MPKKSAQRKPGFIRPSATPVHVYNEGLCVYLHDEGNTEVLRKMLGGGKYPGCTSQENFFANLSQPKFSKDVAAKGLAVAYTLEQDDEISAEVGVGPPLDEQELSVGRWLEPQYARLSLPTGRLRIDSPNTMPLDPDEKQDPGHIVEVPPGDYLLTLYRIDWDELPRAGLKKYKGPQEFILLTPLKDAKKIKAKPAGPILEFTFRKPDPSWKDKQVASGKFTGKLIFAGYWEMFAVNLDRGAAKKLGLQPGSRLQFACDKFKLDGLYLGDMSRADFTQFYTKDRLDRELEKYKEFALSEWGKFGGKQVLQFARYKSTRAVPERLHEVWTVATGIVLPETWTLPQPATTQPAQLKNGAIHATVTFSAPEEVILNVCPEHLESLHAKPGDAFRLSGQNSSRTLIYEADPAARCRHTIVTGDMPPSYENFYRQMAQTQGNRFYTLPRLNPLKPYPGELPVTNLPNDDDWPTVGILAPDVGHTDLQTLRLTPFSVDGKDAPATWSEGLEVGATIEIRK